MGNVLIKPYSQLEKEDRKTIEKLIKSEGFKGEITDEVAERYARKWLVCMLKFMLNVVEFAFDKLIMYQNQLARVPSIPMIVGGKNITREFVKISLQNIQSNIVGNINSNINNLSVGMWNQ